MSVSSGPAPPPLMKIYSTELGRHCLLDVPNRQYVLANGERYPAAELYVQELKLRASRKEDLTRIPTEHVESPDNYGLQTGKAGPGSSPRQLVPAPVGTIATTVHQPQTSAGGQQGATASSSSHGYGNQTPAASSSTPMTQSLGTELTTAGMLLKARVSMDKMPIDELAQTYDSMRSQGYNHEQALTYCELLSLGLNISQVAETLTARMSRQATRLLKTGVKPANLHKYLQKYAEMVNGGGWKPDQAAQYCALLDYGLTSEDAYARILTANNQRLAQS